jgi:hypothetical protein
VELNRRRQHHNKKERRKHEHGVEGELHPNFMPSNEGILRTIKEQQDSSVNVLEVELSHRYPVETVLVELLRVVNEFSPDIKPKVFKEHICV